jgi:hypothetical protein
MIGLDEVAKHSTSHDFWTILDGEVFDMSGYVERHPGGQVILTAAGIDATVLINQYHFHTVPKIKSILAARKVGKFAGKSPSMGAFYWTAASRASDLLRHVPKRTLITQVRWVLDIGLYCLCGIAAIQVKWTTPSWKVAALLGLLWTVQACGVSQDHAMGHLQIWGGRAFPLARIISTLCGGLTSSTYFIPNGSNRNLRKRSHEDRAVAQKEFRFKGPEEHMVLHHVHSQLCTKTNALSQLNCLACTV